jgi:hypothetical protein
MAEFVPDRELTTREPRIDVDPGLKPGKYLFRLVVVNDRGEESAPDERVVTIVDRR